MSASASIVAKAFPVLADGAPGSPLVKGVGQRMLKHDYAVNFALALMHKDLSYAIAEGARAGVPLRTAGTARTLFRRRHRRDGSMTPISPRSSSPCDSDALRGCASARKFDDKFWLPQS